MQTQDRPLRRCGPGRVRRALALACAALPFVATVATGQPARPRGPGGPKEPLPLIAGGPASSASVAVAAASSYAPLTISMPALPRDMGDRGATATEDWYTGYRPARVPVVRVAPGAAFRLAGPGEGAFIFDAVIGARLGLTPGTRQLGLFPEVGYGYNRANGEHQLTAGIGLGFGELPWWGYTALMPRFVFDPGDGKGFRLGLVTQVVETGLSIEIAGQRIYRDVGPNPTDLRFSLGIDLFLLGSVVSDMREWRQAARP